MCAPRKTRVVQLHTRCLSRWTVSVITQSRGYAGSAGSSGGSQPPGLGGVAHRPQVIPPNSESHHWNLTGARQRAHRRQSWLCFARVRRGRRLPPAVSLIWSRCRCWWTSSNALLVKLLECLRPCDRRSAARSEAAALDDSARVG